MVAVAVTEIASGEEKFLYFAQDSLYILNTQTNLTELYQKIAIKLAEDNFTSFPLLVEAILGVQKDSYEVLYRDNFVMDKITINTADYALSPKKYQANFSEESATEISIRFDLSNNPSFHQVVDEQKKNFLKKSEQLIEATRNGEGFFSYTPAPLPLDPGKEFPEYNFDLLTNTFSALAPIKDTYQKYQTLRKSYDDVIKKAQGLYKEFADNAEMQAYIHKELAILVEPKSENQNSLQASIALTGDKIAMLILDIENKVFNPFKEYFYGQQELQRIKNYVVWAVYNGIGDYFEEIQQKTINSPSRKKKVEQFVDHFQGVVQIENSCALENSNSLFDKIQAKDLKSIEDMINDILQSNDKANTKIIFNSQEQIAIVSKLNEAAQRFQKQYASPLPFIAYPKGLIHHASFKFKKVCYEHESNFNACNDKIQKILKNKLPELSALPLTQLEKEVKTLTLDFELFKKRLNVRKDLQAIKENVGQIQQKVKKMAIAIESWPDKILSTYEQLRQNTQLSNEELLRKILPANSNINQTNLANYLETFKNEILANVKKITETVTEINQLTLGQVPNVYNQQIRNVRLQQKNIKQYSNNIVELYESLSIIKQNSDLCYYRFIYDKQQTIRQAFEKEVNASLAKIEKSFNLKDFKRGIAKHKIDISDYTRSKEQLKKLTNELNPELDDNEFQAILEKQKRRLPELEETLCQRYLQVKEQVKPKQFTLPLIEAPFSLPTNNPFIVSAESQNKTPSFFKRHWKKMVLGGTLSFLTMGLIGAGLILFGASLPGIAAFGAFMVASFHLAHITLGTTTGLWLGFSFLSGLAGMMGATTGALLGEAQAKLAKKPAANVFNLEEKPPVIPGTTPNLLEIFNIKTPPSAQTIVSSPKTPEETNPFATPEVSPSITPVLSTGLRLS